MERKLRNSFNLKGATTTSIPSPQTAQHQLVTRQRTAATTLQQQQQPVVYKSPVTTTTTHSIISGPVQKNEKNPNNNNIINEEVSAMTTAADADLNEQQQQEQQQQLAVAAHAKPLSRNKNEGKLWDLSPSCLVHVFALIFYCFVLFEDDVFVVGINLSFI